MDPGAYDVIKDCLKAQAAHQTGLTYVVTTKDATAISIRFYWNPTTAPYELPVRAFADYATSLDPDAKGKQLFSPAAKLRPSGTLLELTRTQPEKPVRIVLKTTPPVDYEPIYIEPVKPSPKYKQTWVITTFSDNPDPENPNTFYKTGEENYDAVYERKMTFAGPVISASCSFNAAYYHMQLCQPTDPEHKIVVCRANKGRSSTRSNWATTIKYLNPITACIANCGFDTAATIDEDSPANYSFNTAKQLLNEERACLWQAEKKH